MSVKPPLEMLTERMIAAAQTEDLDALGEALANRALALADPSVYSADELAAALHGGEIALAAIECFKQRIQAEHGRLSRMRDSFLAVSTDAPMLDLRG